MATKSKAAAAEETIQKEEPIEAEVTAKQDPWEDMVQVIVPRKPKGDDQQFYVCVNDRRFLIPANGKAQMLPRPVAEVLQETLKAEYEADEYADHIPNRSGDNLQDGAI